MADPNTTPGATPGTTATGATGDATTTTQAGYHAETVRVAPTGTTDTVHTADTDKSAATKGLIVGVLTFLALSLWEWLDGATGAEGDAITFPEMAIYAVVGIVVGVIVKMIAKR